MIDCYIIDDDPDAIGLLKSYISQTPGLNLVFSSTLAQEVLPYISRTTHPVIAFIDIEMPFLSGLKLAEMVSDQTAVVFVSGHTSYALQAYQLNVWDYLVKPVSYDRFFQAVIKVSKRMLKFDTPLVEQRQKFIFIPQKNGGLLRILLDEIVFAEMLENYAKIHIKDSMHMVHITLKQLLYQLASSRFIQVHKSYMINIDHIVHTSGSILEMSNGEKVPIGQTYKESLVIKLSSRLIR